MFCLGMQYRWDSIACLHAFHLWGRHALELQAGHIVIRATMQTWSRLPCSQCNSQCIVQCWYIVHTYWLALAQLVVQGAEKHVIKSCQNLGVLCRPNPVRQSQIGAGQQATLVEEKFRGKVAER